MPSDTIFFSYSRSDSDFVLKIAKDLRNAGFNIWLDQLDIRPGSRWDDAIQAALNQSRTLIVILSSSSVASENVMDEVSFAIGNKKNLIPVLLNECVTPFRLSRFQRVDFTGDYKIGLDYLVETLDYHGARKNETVSEKQGPETSSAGVLETKADGKQQKKEQHDGSLWQEAVNINSIASYTKYINESINGSHIEEARQCISKFETEQKNKEIEQVTWDKAKEENSIYSFNRYITEYPRGIYKADALTAIEDIERIKEQEKAIATESLSYDDNQSGQKNKSKKYIYLLIAVVIIGAIVFGSIKMNLFGKHDSTKNADIQATGDSISKAQQDSINIAKTNAQASIDSISKARQDSINITKTSAQAKIDSISKARQDSIKILESLTVGSKYGGGIVVKLRDAGKPGLIAAEQDLKGLFNWEDANKECSELILDGHSDWRLPNKNELASLYTQKSAIGNFNGSDYWSSTVTTKYTANHCEFSEGGYMGHNTKTARYSVRPVRNF